jgi:hypothetical protein
MKITVQKVERTVKVNVVKRNIVVKRPVSNISVNQVGRRGLQGATGQDGLSAYQVWLSLGNTGSEADYLASLKGDKGDKGDQGDPGPQGDPGVDGRSFNWLGAWDGGTAYEIDDVVERNGSSYIAIAANTASAPPSADWELMAQKGADGAGAGDMLASVYDPAGKEKQLAADDEVVKLTGNQSINGNKTFNDGVASLTRVAAPSFLLNEVWGSWAVNAYFDSGWKYQGNGVAALIESNGAEGGFNFYYAAAGLAENTVSWVPVASFSGLGIDAKNFKLINLADPTANQHAATKKYVDDKISAIPAAPVSSVNGQTGAVTLAKADVGLGNVDNTSDANKPISTATQNALDGKVGSDTSVSQVIALTQAEYDAIVTKDPTTLYFIKDL